ALPMPEGAFANVELVGTVPDAAEAISINFIHYEGGRDVMFVSSYNGIQSYDITRNPAEPVPLGKITHAEMGQPGDTSDKFFENEDMDVDAKRKLLFFTRDLTSNTSAEAGIYIIDAKDPAKLTLIKFQPLPEGHTSSCIEDCKYVWTAGLLARREIFATDL